MVANTFWGVSLQAQAPGELVQVARIHLQRPCRTGPVAVVARQRGADGGALAGVHGVAQRALGGVAGITGGLRWLWRGAGAVQVRVDPDAGSGAQAAPFFRIFNPELQAKKFDPDGRYVREWAPDATARPPIVDLAASRKAALAAYDAVKRA